MEAAMAWKLVSTRRVRLFVAATAMLGAAMPLAHAGPLGAATFAGGDVVTAAPQVEAVSWRGRRNTALVAGALGLTALGIAAAAASQPRYGDGYGYGYEPYGYGYQPHGYRYAPSPRYRPVDDYGYGYAPVRPRYRYVEEDVVYSAPYRAPRNRKQPFYHDYGRGLERGIDPAGK
jgi:hypothetical protein